MRRFKSTNRKPRRSRRATGRRALAGISRRRCGGRRRVLASSTNEKIARDVVDQVIESIDVDEVIQEISKKNHTIGNLYEEIEKRFKKLIEDYLSDLHIHGYIFDLEDLLDKADSEGEDPEDIIEEFSSEMREEILKDLVYEFKDGRVLLNEVISGGFCESARDWTPMLDLASAARPLYPQIKRALKKEGYPDIDPKKFMRVVLEGFGLDALYRLDDTVVTILETMVDDFESDIEDAYLHSYEYFPEGDSIDSQIEWTFDSLDMYWCYSLAREVCR